MGKVVLRMVRRCAVAGFAVSLLVGGVVVSGQFGAPASASGQTNRAVVYPTAPITSAPTAVVTGATSPAVTQAGFTGSANPGGLPTTASFQYGLDPKYSGGGPVVYTQSTPAQTVGSDFSSHAVSASVTGLVADAVYHVRLVATNSAGTTPGPDTTFTTQPAPAPSPPTLGQTFNIAPVSGVVLIKVNGQFVPLTQLRQIPQNVVINALHGTLSLITGSGGGQGARDAAASRRKKVKTQSGTFGGAIFKLRQAHSGLATLTLVEGAYTGAPTYAACRTKARDAAAAASSSKTLQLLHASAKGKFSTRGRYSAATVLGTKWTIADRCDGTLTHDITDSVAVVDFVHHKTIILHAGQSYLAKAPTRR